MRLYSQFHDFTCGIDLHSRSMYLCVLDREAKTWLHRNLPCRPAAFLEAIAPYRSDLVVGCECLFSCTDWRMCARRRGSPSSSATPSRCAPSTA